MNSVSAVSSSSAQQPSLDPRPTVSELARRGDPAELRAFAEANPDQAEALRTELARTNPGALFALEQPATLPEVVVTAQRPPAEPEKSWIAERLDDARGFVQDHDGSEAIAEAGDWAQSKIDSIRTDIPVLSQGASGLRALLGFGKDTVQGIASLPGTAVNATVGTMQTGVAIAEGRTTVGEVASGAWETAKALPGAMAKPVTDAWSRGDYVEAVTRGVTEIATLPLAPTKAGAVSRVADAAGDVGRAADAAGDVARGADAAADAGRVADSVPPRTPPIREPWQRQDLDERWFGDDGRLIWPDGTRPGTLPDGFSAPPVRETLTPGAIIDRYGSERGRFFSPDGASFESRALPNDPAATPYARYEVLKPFDVDSGSALPWFDQAGGATQYKTELTVRQLIDEGFIREVPHDR